MSRSVIDERFSSDVLDQTLWVDHYLPHWTEPSRSSARYDLPGQSLRLRIDADQRQWRPADGPMRVSNVQTGTFSGPVGSDRGTHRHRLDGLRVVTPQPTRRLWTARAGEVSVNASASPDPTCMVGIWLVGFEESGPDDSGELCIAELFGDRISGVGSTVRVGIKAHHDPRLFDDVRDIDLPFDATKPHAYGVRWSPDEVVFSVDDEIIMTSEQRIDYELQLMVDLFEFPVSDHRDPADYPKTAMIHSVVARAS